MSASNLYWAFASGSLTYDCAPCGRCCRGLGIADDTQNLAGNAPLIQLAPYMDGQRSQNGPLASFFTYADGCRYVDDENICQIHRDQGRDAKPRICKLFPFSKILDVDGMWALLPHHDCPWQAASQRPDPLSTHENIHEDLDPTLLAQLTPTPWNTVTPVAAADRMSLETKIRDSIDIDADPSAVLAQMRELHATLISQAGPAIPEGELWFDILRCVGDPTPLSQPQQRLFNAAIPMLRILALPHFSLAQVPIALTAFELWLRTLRELSIAPLSGQDLQHLWATAAPLVRIMVLASGPTPDLSSIDAPETLRPLLHEIEQDTGDSFGLRLVAVLRELEQGALSHLYALGQCLTPHP